MQYKLIALLLVWFYPLLSGAGSRVPENAIYAAQIVDLNNNEVVYEHQADKLLTPASNQKIITLYAALKLLDKKASFSTDAFILFHHHNKSLKDLYIKFSANPFLTRSDLKSLIMKIKSKGVLSLDHIVIDDSEFDEEFFPPDWMVGNLKFSFSAPISPIIVNQNYFKVGVSLNPQKKLILKDVPAFVKLINKAYYDKKDSDCELELKAFYNNEYILHGCYRENKLPPSLQIAIQDPRLYIKKLLAQLLQEEGVKYHAIVFDQVPNNSNPIVTISSPTLADILKKMMYESDNLIAELLVKKIAKQVSYKEGNWDTGIKAIANVLKQEVKFGDTDFIIKDGSGGSRKNLISPNAMVKILAAAYNDSSIRERFLSAFPYAGQIGSTLENRFNGLSPGVKIYAKTGSLDNVSTLAGYVFFDNGKCYAFSIMANNAVCEVCTALKNYEEETLTLALNLPFN